MAQTINLANIKIGLDISEIKKNGEFTRAEIASLSRTAKAAESPMQKLAKDVALLDRAFAAGGMSSAQYNAMVDQLAKKHGLSAVYAERSAAAEAKLADAKRKAAEETKRAEQQQSEQAKLAAQREKAAAEQARIAAEKQAAARQKMIESLQRRDIQTADPFAGWAMDKKASDANSLAGALGRLSVVGASLAGAKGVIDFAKASAGLAMQREQVQAQMEVLTGSANAARKLIQATIELDQVSALSATNLQDAAKVLLGYGMSSVEVSKSLGLLSEISMGSNEKLSSLALAFGQVQANGRLMGQEVLQMVNAGFNPLQEISRTTGESMASLRKRMEDGKVSFQEVAKAMETATSAGGRFFGMNAKMAETTSVKFAKLQSQIQLMMAREGSQILPGINRVLDAVSGITELNKTRLKQSEQEVSFYKEMEQAEKAREAAEVKRAQAARQRQIDEEASLKRRAEEEKRIAQIAEQSNKSFRQSIEKIAEENARAKLGDIAFQEQSLRFQEDFQMTEGERLQAESAILQMRETRALNTMRRLQEELDRATLTDKQLAEKEMRDQGLSDADIKKAMLLRDEIEAAKQRRKIEEEINAIARERGITPEQAIQQRQREMARKAATEQVDKEGPSVATSIKAGTLEAFRFMRDSQNKQQREKKIETLTENIFKEMQEANKFNREAPRLALARN